MGIEEDGIKEAKMGVTRDIISIRGGVRSQERGMRGKSLEMVMMMTLTMIMMSKIENLTPARTRWTRRPPRRGRRGRAERLQARGIPQGEGKDREKLGVIK